MYCARVFNGIGTGILNAITPVWATETAEHTSRGQFVAIEFTLNIFGVAVAYWLEFGLSYLNNGESAIRWRFPIAFQIIPLIFLFFAVWFFPESPRWLVKVGREDEARYVLTRLRGGNEDPTTEGKADAEFEDIRNVAELERKAAGATSYWSMFIGKGSGKLHTGRRVQLVIWLQILQEWIGISGKFLGQSFPQQVKDADIALKRRDTVPTYYFQLGWILQHQSRLVERFEHNYLHHIDAHVCLYLGPHWKKMDPLLVRPPSFLIAGHTTNNYEGALLRKESP